MKRNILIFTVLSSSAAAQLQSPTEAPEALLARRLKAHAEVINRWDTNKDGKLNDEEKKAFHDDRLKEADLRGKQDALAELDLNKDGKLSVDEFWKVRYPPAKYETVLRMTRADSDNDGKVSEAERQALEDRTLQEYAKAARGKFNGSRMQFDANKDGKLTGLERSRSEEFDLDQEIWRLKQDVWDGLFAADEKALLSEFIRSNRFILEKSDTNQDGMVSNDEKEADVLPEPVKRTVTDSGGRKQEVTLLETSPFTVRLILASGKFSYTPLIQLSAADRRFIIEWSAVAQLHAFKPVKFTAKDGLEVTADFYDTGEKSKPVILYGHRANSSRGEYRRIASRLVEQGYNGLAVDLRNGKSFAGVPNETSSAWMAREPKPDTMEVAFLYDRSKPDIEAALAWLKQQGFTGPLILWGSSYSSSLVIILAADDPAVDAVLAFSPGEWLSKKNGKRSKETEAASRLNRPVLAVQPEQERKEGDPVFEALVTTEKTMLMSRDVLHGSNTLLKAKNRAETWDAVLKFLASVKDVPVEVSMLQLITGSQWEKVAGSSTRTFAADGTFSSADKQAAYKVTGRRTLTISFSRGIVIPCQMNEDCTEFEELSHEKHKWRKVKK